MNTKIKKSEWNFNMKKKGVFAVSAAFALVLSGCGGKSNKTAEKDTTENTKKAVEEIKTEKAAKDFEVVPYAMESYGFAVDVPSDFSQSSSAVSGTLFFDGTESDDQIVVSAFDSQTADDFSDFTQEELFDKINLTTTLPQVEYFKETSIKNKNNIDCKAFVGETLGTIDGEDTYVTALAVNCAEQGKMYVVAMRDKTGEFEKYRENISDYIYLNERGYVVENNKLEEAPEPQDMSYSSSDYHYSINLPTGWKFYDDASSTGYLVMGGIYDFFMNDDRECIMISRSGGSYTDEVFYASIEQSKDRIVNSSSYNITASKECRVYDYAAYQIISKCIAGSMEGMNRVTWVVNYTGESGGLYSINYYYNDDTKENLSDNLMDCITFGTAANDNANAATTEQASESGVYNASNTKRIGNDTVGYIDVPSEFVEFKEIGGLQNVVDGVQYSDATGTAIFTLSAYNNSELTAEQAANNAYLNCKAESGSEVTGAEVDIAGYKAKQVYTYYENEKKYLVIWAFETSEHDNYTHYLSIEFPENYKDIWELNQTFGFNS